MQYAINETFCVIYIISESLKYTVSEKSDKIYLKIKSNFRIKNTGVRCERCRIMSNYASIPHKNVCSFSVYMCIYTYRHFFPQCWMVV
jgi:hypothetical protein